MCAMHSVKAYQGARILVADDTEELLTIIQLTLSTIGAHVSLAHDGKQAIELLHKEPFDLVLCDYDMPHHDGMQVLREARKIKPTPPLFILMTGKGTIELAVDAMREGAFHFIEKPVPPDELLERVCAALDNVMIAVENRALRNAVESHYIFSEIIGNSKALHDVLDVARRAAEQSSPVLVLGESGTGKDLFSRAIHFHSPRAKRPFIPINCGAIPESLIESEFFGHRKGAFTGAIENRKGCFEEADGGTLFLDEIGEMPLDMQVKLLRVLEERKIRRIGENVEIPVDFRIIAATNRPLAELVEQGRFRQDLYYRLNVLIINIPPLRDRREDIIPLAKHILRNSQKDLKTHVETISPAALEALQSYSYPGNVRELHNIMQRAMLLCDIDRLERCHLPAEVLKTAPAEHGEDDVIAAITSVENFDLKAAIKRAQEEVEKRLIEKALATSAGNHKQAAQLLGISRASLYNKIGKPEDESEAL
ncbi:TPA: hypothetical protein DDW35_00925 [Candidatus Sumerlaeota bacterium]|jgi:two-component system, NtrC family, response regulator PilR|nr:hypothetical protein [Candidatus Sumerlaeota bacterium]